MKEQLEQKEIEYVRGKTAGNAVYDNEANSIVQTGDKITDEVIRRAVDTGQLHYLMIAAASTVVGTRGEEAGRRLQEFRDVTEGHEVEFVRGRQAGCDVRTVQGDILAKQGDTITDDIIECATRNNALDKLVIAVGAPGLLSEAESTGASEEEEEDVTATKMGYTPYAP